MCTSVAYYVSVKLIFPLVDINNVGSISQALFAKGNPNYDEGKAARLQASQVSIVSIMNCLGRVSIGQ